MLTVQRSHTFIVAREVMAGVACAARSLWQNNALKKIHFCVDNKSGRVCHNKTTIKEV